LAQFVTPDFMRNNLHSLFQPVISLFTTKSKLRSQHS